MIGLSFLQRLKSFASLQIFPAAQLLQEEISIAIHFLKVIYFLKNLLLKKNKLVTRVGISQLCLHSIHQ